MTDEPADRIVSAFDTRTLIEPFAAGMSLDEAFAVAEAVHTRRLARGERQVGRKIGFTNRSLWEHFDVHASIWAPVYDTTTTYAEAGRAAAHPQRLIQPLIEPEVQLHFTRTPPAGGDEEAVLACVDWVSLGFELVQCPYPGWRFTAPDSIVACALHGALVVGTPVPVARIDDCAAKLRGFSALLSRAGERVAEGCGADALGSPLQAVSEVSEVLEAQEKPIQPGEVVTTGTLTFPPPIAPGERWTLSAAGIELPELELDLVAD